MSPYTKKQKRLFGADLARKRRGQTTRTGMSERQLVEGVRAPTKTAKKSARRKK